MDELAEARQDGYVAGFEDGRATTYPPNERAARLNELCRAHDLILARRDPSAVAELLRERMARLREHECQD